MKVSCWLLIETIQPRYGRPEVRISGMRKRRPVNEMAVRVTLDIDPDDLQPKVEALVEAGMIELEIEFPEDDEPIE